MIQGTFSCRKSFIFPLFCNNMTIRNILPKWKSALLLLDLSSFTRNSSFGQERENRAVGLGSSVVLSLTESYNGTNWNVTCDNYFTDIQIGRLGAKGLTLVGTVIKNKRFLPPQFLPNKLRLENSSLFGFKQKETLVSYESKNINSFYFFQ